MQLSAANQIRIARAGYLLSAFCGLFACIFAFASGVLLFMLGAQIAVDRHIRTLPSYPREDISALVDKTEFTEEETELLMRQTGLGRSALEEIRGADLLAFQDALFFQGELRHEEVSPVTEHDYLVDPETGKTYAAPLVPLQAGDVLISSTSHSFGWKNGHAALVVDPLYGTVLQSIEIGFNSEFEMNGVKWFREAANFMVLRLKDADAATRKAIADAACETLVDIPYSITVGIFSPKDQCKGGRAPKETLCSHLVWQAYKNFGYDTDADGGPVVTPRDLANSPLFEVVQCYGFDPTVGW